MTPTTPQTGKRVTCEGCGACCLHMSSPPYDDEERDLLRENLPKVYADFLAVEATRVLQLQVVGTDFIPCGFFNLITRKCIHHNHHPDVCERHEVGGIYCLEMRKDAGF